MIYRRIYYPLTMLAFVLIFSGCKYGEDFKTFNFKTGEGHWQIDYPPYMRITRKVYPGAEFQATNGYRDTNVFLKRLRTSNSAAVMSDSLTSTLTGVLEDARIASDTTYTLEGGTFHTVRLTGMMKDKRMYYLTSVIEKDDVLFHFTAWMFNSKKELWGEDYEQMLHSWKP